MRTFVYVDGFNLYYGAVRDTPYKWLDISQLARRLLPPNKILRIKYFTALVSGRPGDPDQPVRQQIYLRALQTIPHLEIVLGHFLTNEVSLPRADGKGYIRVLKTEEKGSDVNLAAHLIHDAYRGEFEVAALVTNDSDLAEAVRIVTQELGLKVGILTPTRTGDRTPSRALRRHATFMKPIREGVLRDSQFPETLRDARGVIRKPRGW